MNDSGIGTAVFLLRIMTTFLAKAVFSSCGTYLWHLVMSLKGSLYNIWLHMNYARNGLK